MIPPHGTYTRYKTHGCKCTQCRKANARYHNQLRSKRYKKPLPTGVKHNRSTYFNWGCTCEVCRADVNRYMQAYRQKGAGKRG